MIFNLLQRTVVQMRYNFVFEARIIEMGVQIADLFPPGPNIGTVDMGKNITINIDKFLITSINYYE